MTRERRLAGVGGIAFATSLVVGFTLYGPKGGRYSAAEVERFVGQTSTSLIISIGLFVISIFGLIVLLDYLAETSFGSGPGAQVTWATGLLAAVSFLIGWALYLAPSSANGSGGPAVDPGVSYLLVSAGMLVLFGVGGITLGIALITLAVGGRAAPAWVRATNGVAGISALLTWAFLVGLQWSPNQWLPGPFYVVVLWGLITGIWLLVSSAPQTADES